MTIQFDRDGRPLSTLSPARFAELADMSVDRVRQLCRDGLFGPDAWKVPGSSLWTIRADALVRLGERVQHDDPDPLRIVA